MGINRLTCSVTKPKIVSVQPDDWLTNADLTIYHVYCDRILVWKSFVKIIKDPKDQRSRSETKPRKSLAERRCFCRKLILVIGQVQRNAEISGLHTIISAGYLPKSRWMGLIE